MKAGSKSEILRYLAKKRTEGSYTYSQLGRRIAHDFADGRSCMMIGRASEKITFWTMPQRAPFHLVNQPSKHCDYPIKYVDLEEALRFRQWR